MGAVTLELGNYRYEEFSMRIKKIIGLIVTHTFFHRSGISVS